MESSTLKAARLDLIDRVRAHLKLPRNTKKALAEAASLHANTLQGVEDAGWNPSYETLVALEPHVAPPLAKVA